MPIRQGMRAAAYLVLTPFFLFLGWSTLAGALVAATGQADATSAKVLVSVSTLLMLPLGVAFGWRHRHRSLRLPARLFLTPILLFFGFWVLAGLLVSAAGQASRTSFYGTLGTVIALISLLTIPLGVGLAWRYRHRSLRLPAHLMLTPIVLYLGWWLVWVLLLWSTGQESLVYGPVGTFILVVSLLTVPLGIAVGWLRYRRR